CLRALFDTAGPDDSPGVDGLFVNRLVNIRYLTGFSGSNAQLLLTDGEGAFLTDTRYEEQSRREVPDLARRIYTGEFVAAFRDPWAEAGSPRVGFEAAGLSYKTYEELGAIEGIELVSVADVVDRLRWSKDEEEIAVIEGAQRITDDAFDHILGELKEGVTEREVAVELEEFMRRGGAERVAFDTIVAFGEQAAEPHHHPTDRVLGSGDVVKLDFGCFLHGYHSDMTRTIAFGDPGPELREVYGLVHRAHLAGILAVREGAVGGTCDEAARRVIRKGGFGDRFGHSLGHGVGHEVHEGPYLRREGDDLLPEGAVVTVEPGVYLPGAGGVRIEDMVVVTSDGCRPLPRSPKELLVL
ncbi:MAG: M24 family metallopeptidase, partial [Actinomycetota bacterium]